jgi:hypothetical protein
MRGLDPRICRWREMAGSSPAMTAPSIVIPAKAGIQLHVFGSKLDPDFRQGDDVKWI